MRILLSLPLLLCLLCLSACARETLYMQSGFINRDTLASSYVGTPDPAQENPTLGQRILVRWALSHKKFSSLQHPELLVDLNFKGGQDEHIRFQLLDSRGTYTYQLLDAEFFKKGVIRTYRARIMDGDTVVASWQHQLWAERIEIGQ